MELKAQTISYSDLDGLCHKSGDVNSSWAEKQPYVILISIDGYRHDYTEKFNAKNIAKLIETGVSTPSLIPSFPSKTFPNHYTIVTGMYPANHGLVTNGFYSRSRQEWYKISDVATKSDPSWYGGKPLWALAGENNMLSASFFWVGSDAYNQITPPDYYFDYKDDMPNSYRIRQIIDWLNLPEAQRPHLITAYFSLVDNAGHSFGPDSPKTGNAVNEIDTLIGSLQRSLEQLNLPIQLILVSDHGMAEINRGVLLTDITDLEGVKISRSFPPMLYSDNKQKLDQIYNDVKADGRITVYKQNELPEHWHMQNDDKIGDLVLYTEAPTIILLQPSWVKGGAHGFDPSTNPDMGALFVAKGSLLKSNYTKAPFQNIHLYPFIAKLLGLSPPDSIDGDENILNDLFLEK